MDYSFQKNSLILVLGLIYLFLIQLFLQEPLLPMEFLDMTDIIYISVMIFFMGHYIFLQTTM